LPIFDDAWVKLDRDYVSAKLGKEELLLRAETKGALHRIQRERISQGHLGPTVDDVLEIYGTHLQKTLVLIYEVHESVCLEQGNVLTPEFLRAVFTEALNPAIKAKAEECEELAENALRLMNVRGARLFQPLNYFRDLAQELTDYWKHGVEERAKKLKYEAESKRPTPRTGRGRPKGPSDKTREIRKAVMEVREELACADRPKPSTREIVNALDRRRNVPLPKKWAKLGIKNWRTLFQKEQPRRLVTKYLSKIKKKAT